jgi:hypothetical protein
VSARLDIPTLLLVNESPWLFVPVLLLLAACIIYMVWDRRKG